MKKQINLIPVEMTVPTKTVKLVKILNKISIIGAIFLILIILIFISGLIYYNIEYKKSVSNVNTLKDKIITLEKSEQKLILAKDKLSKIAYIKSIDAVDDELTNFIELKSLVSSPSASTFTEISIDPKKTELSLTFPNSLDLSGALKSLPTLTKYKRIVLSSLGYSKNSGFLVSLILED